MRYGPPGSALCSEALDLGSVREHPRTAKLFALVAGGHESSPHALGDADACLFRDGGNDCDHGVAEDAARVRRTLVSPQLVIKKRPSTGSRSPANRIL